MAPRFLENLCTPAFDDTKSQEQIGLLYTLNSLVWTEVHCDCCKMWVFI